MPAVTIDIDTHENYGGEGSIALDTPRICQCKEHMFDNVLIHC